MKQFIDEWCHIFKGKFALVAILAPLVISVVFGFVMQNGTVNEAPTAVIDLDNTTKSRGLINKFDSSQYINVAATFYEEIDPNELFYNEKYLAIIYIPEGFEENSAIGKQTNIGAFYDMSVPSAIGNLRSGVTEVVSTENATVTVGALKSMGLSTEQASGIASQISTSQRLLYNPVNNTLNISVIAFLNTAILGVITGATIGIVPRLRQQGRLKESLKNPIGIIARLIPYAMILTTSLYLSFGLLKQIGGMRYEADAWQMWIPFLMYAFCAGLFAMILGWTAPTPEKAGSRSMVAIILSFLLGGVQLPTLMLPDVLQKVSDIVPLAWHFKFIRGMGFRGADISYFTQELRQFGLVIIGYMAVVVVLVVLEWIKIQKNKNKEQVIS